MGNIYSSPGLRVHTSFEFEPENALCVLRFSGRLTPDAILAAFRSARQDDGWRDEYDWLTLLDQVTMGNISAETIDAFITHIQQMRAEEPIQGRRAAIVCNDPFSKATLTYWEVASQGRLPTEERIFQHESQARAWLASSHSLSDTAG